MEIRDLTERTIEARKARKVMTKSGGHAQTERQQTFFGGQHEKQRMGGGLPPINTVCEYLLAEGDEWRKCKIAAYYFANVVAVDVLDSTAVLLRAGLFRPIKTPGADCCRRASKCY